MNTDIIPGGIIGWAIWAVSLACILMLGIVGIAVIISGFKKNSRLPNGGQDNWMGPVSIGILLVSISVAGVICFYPMDIFANAPEGSAYAKIHTLAGLYLASYAVTFMWGAFFFYFLVIFFILGCISMVCDGFR